MTEPRDSRAIEMADAVSDMLQSAFAGERAVEAASRNGRGELGRTALFPSHYKVRRIDADLNFEASDKKSWQLAWIKKSDRRPLATLRVTLGIEPSLDHPMPMPASRAVRMLVPRFLDCPGDPENLDLRCSNGRTLTVDLHSPTGRITTDAGDSLELLAMSPAPTGEDASGPPQERFTGIPERWPMNALVALLETVAHWRRGLMPSAARRFELVAGLGEDLFSLLRKILEGCNRVSETVRSAAVDASSISDMHLSALSATARVCLENKGGGDLELDRWRSDSSAQQLDFIFSPGAVTEDGATVLSFDLPDFLVEGALHDRFLAALGAAADRVAESLSTSMTGATHLDAAAVLGVLEGSRAAGRTCAVRISHDNTDLVLLRGDASDLPVAGLLLEVQFAIATDGAVSIAGKRNAIRLVAHLEHGAWHGSQQADDLKAPFYFARLLRTLHALQKCVAADLVNPGDERR